MTLDEVRTQAPPHPPCMSSQAQWVDYLHSCMEEGKHGDLLPFRFGVYNDSFNFCLDCTPDFEGRMRAEKRCEPKHFVVPVREITRCSSKA